MGSRVYITLKNTLKWIPVVGWGMQFFNFIFLARSWASDKLQLASALAALVKEDGPLAFIIYPEGTLVSNMTRPISKKFAEKMGIVSPLCTAWLGLTATLAGPDQFAASPLNRLALLLEIPVTTHQESASAGPYDYISRYAIVATNCGVMR